MSCDFVMKPGAKNLACAGLVLLGVGVRLQSDAAETAVVDAALKAVAEADRAADARWCACGSPEELRKLQAETRAKVVESMGALPERCALDAVTVGRVRRDGYSIEKVLFASEPNHHVTAHLFLPDPAPCVVTGPQLTCERAFTDNDIWLRQPFFCIFAISIKMLFLH